MPARPSVVIHRIPNGWRAEIGVPARCVHARNVAGLFAQLRLLVDLTAARIGFQTGDPEVDALLVEIRAAWRRADEARSSAQALTERLLCHADGLSNRDIAPLVGRSHQRIAQLRRQARPNPGKPRPRG